MPTDDSRDGAEPSKLETEVSNADPAFDALGLLRAAPAGRVDSPATQKYFGRASSEAPGTEEVAPVQPSPKAQATKYSITNGELKLDLSDAEKDNIGARIRLNESNTTKADGPKGLAEWNNGEDFPSLGIGHFIWTKQGSVSEAKFGNSFSPFIKYLEDTYTPAFLKLQGMPSWLNSTMDMPWKDQAAFLKDPRRDELAKFLAQTVNDQTDFIVSRIEQAYAKMVQASDNPTLVEKNFARMLNAGAPGVFAVTDYVNFKGEGLEKDSGDNRTAWGLRQALEGMKDTGDPLRDFADSAIAVLTNRVNNAPANRKATEQGWLPGWTKRINRYVDEKTT